MKSDWLTLTRVLLGLVLIWLAGCASTVPVAASCPEIPAPPKEPTERAKSASTVPALTERYSSSEEKLRDSLQKAIRP